MTEPHTQFSNELLHRLAYQPDTAPPGIRLTGNYGAYGHGGPGHQDEPDDECGTLIGGVCFRGAFIHTRDAIYQIDRYHPDTQQWSAHWPD